MRLNFKHYLLILNRKKEEISYRVEKATLTTELWDV